jgi:hypothetical protein
MRVLQVARKPRQTALLLYFQGCKCAEFKFHRRLLSLFLTILVAYLLVLALVRMFESHLIFFPNYHGRLHLSDPC